LKLGGAARIVAEWIRLSEERETVARTISRPPRLGVSPATLYRYIPAARTAESSQMFEKYPLSPRIQTLKAILAKIRPEPVREPLPRLKHYEPPRASAKRRR